MFIARNRIILGVIIAVIAIVVFIIVPLFMGCQTGGLLVLPTQCSLGMGGDSYAVTGKVFTIGRLANWRQSLLVPSNSIVTVQVDGTLDLVNAVDRGFVHVNDLTLIRGDGTIRAAGDYSEQLFSNAPIFGSGTVVFDGNLRLEAHDLSGSVVNLNFRGSRLVVNDHVTLNATGTNVTGFFVFGDLDMRYYGEPETPTFFVEGSEAAIGVHVQDGQVDLSNVHIRVEGPNSVGVMGGNVMIIRASQIHVPEGIAVQMVGDGGLLILAFTRISGGTAAIRGDDGVQTANLQGWYTGNIDLGGGDDALELVQDTFLILESGEITTGAGNDVLTLDYDEGVIDSVLDGGDGTDTLVVNLGFPQGDDTPTAEEIAAADGELELPEFTLRWTNFEDVQIAYEEETAESGTEGETEATPEATDEAG